jgi:hypothetical protein
MTPTGHILTGTAIGVLFMPDYETKRQKAVHLTLFAFLANIPDLPIENWGHDRYYFSHSLFVNMLLIGLGILAIFAYSKFRSQLVPWRLMIGGSICWLSHLLLDSFYNHGKGIAIYWPFSKARLALPIPWLAVSTDPFFSITFEKIHIFLLEFVSFFPLLILAVLIRRTRIPHCEVGPAS